MKRNLNLLVIIAFALCGCGKTAAPDADKSYFYTDYDELHYDCDGKITGDVDKITVFSNLAWSVDYAPEWVVPSVSSGGDNAVVAFEVKPNEGAESRLDVVTFCNGTKYCSVDVYQAGRIELSLSVDSVLLDSGACTESVSVVCGGRWSVTGCPEWMSLSATSGSGDATVQISVSANTAFDNRGATLVFSTVGADDAKLYVEQNGSTEQLPDREGMNIKGVVTCGGRPVGGVVISDGRVTTQTDSRGVYYLASEKQMQEVFISVPSGYLPSVDPLAPSFPIIHKTLSEGVSAVERADFVLERIEGGNVNHTVLFFTDIHLMDYLQPTARYKDITRLTDRVLPDITAEISYIAQPNTYAVCLGDLTHDTHWYSGGYSGYHLGNYYNTMRGFPLLTFNVIGNHDNDPQRSGDWATQRPFVNYIAPTYYSFNLGDIHYVVLDNTLYGGDGWTDVTSTLAPVSDPMKWQLEWLESDLKYVSKQTKIVVCQHAPMMNIDSNNGYTSSIGLAGATRYLLPLLSGYTVEFYSGHLHANHNMKNAQYTEHNLAALSGNAWAVDCQTGTTHTDYDMCCDGSPAGYLVVDNKGVTDSWYYKGVGIDRNRLFSLYDVNDSNVIPKEYYSYMGAVSADMVIINVWNGGYDWTVEATENGTPLSVTRQPMRDARLTYWEKVAYPKVTPFSHFGVSHMYNVKCSVPNSKIKIKVTDPFGRVAVDSLVRCTAQ